MIREWKNEKENKKNTKHRADKLTRAKQKGYL